ncbi:Calmodulin-binding receptor-like cytoplasmic kinase 2 [Apostasia shenzhenica]|uniref:Calmodulin-binding receptor-like cytoplasmic kinase 2 n=1 Tax=Apostasia shenzhenica TaxID=1088818 RepID=A0A2H9ZYT3_9ASPA|nr:Calmodulin-binding receptor-like cytoplasmic kinase 2 [Apostasia shenzhenica]
MRLYGGAGYSVPNTAQVSECDSVGWRSSALRESTTSSSAAPRSSSITRSSRHCRPSLSPCRPLGRRCLAGTLAPRPGRRRTAGTPCGDRFPPSNPPPAARPWRLAAILSLWPRGSSAHASLLRGPGRQKMNSPMRSSPPRVKTTSASGSNYGSFPGNVRRLSGRGIWSNESRSTKIESGGMRFTMAEIHRATKNFSPSLKIGQGGFGTVYKGMLNDGMAVAVKRAKKVMFVDLTQNAGFQEFQSEIQTLARVEHLNLVRFMGFLEYEDERILVVEYVCNGNLREHLDCLHGICLDLAARLDIAIDVAHAITYLHMYTGREEPSGEEGKRLAYLRQKSLVNPCDASTQISSTHSIMLWSDSDLVGAINH